ncbi:MAG TPA: hypothetical protein ENI06_03725 [Spirochaetales bacterium]|nr:hypothetical protein [Spirochaetales bacterium]
MKISLGPVPLNWGKEKLLSFYGHVADSKVSNVYLGEVTCPKRESSIDDLMPIIDMLREKGKKVYISSYALTFDGLERGNIEALLEASDGLEINNLAFLSIKTEKELVAGPFLNVYNWRAARYLSRFGIKKVVIPWEVGRKSIEDIVEKSDLNIEVVAHGHLPVALSRECYTVRSLSSLEVSCQEAGISRSNCDKECFQHPEGFFLKAISGELVFKINGPQVFSAKVHCLIEHMDYLKRLKVESIRIESQLEEDIDEVINIYREVLDNRLNEKKAGGRLKALCSDDLCNGFFLGKPGWEYQ